MIEVETIWNLSARCCKRLNHAAAASAVGKHASACHFHCKQQEQETDWEEMLPVDSEPDIGAIYVPSNSLLLMEQICGYL